MNHLTQFPMPSYRYSLCIPKVLVLMELGLLSVDLPLNHLQSYTRYRALIFPFPYFATIYKTF